jgi:hypothetical protein
MAVKVQLVNHDGSHFRTVEIGNFYVRPEAVVADGRVFVTKDPEEQREGLKYTAVSGSVIIQC